MLIDGFPKRSLNVNYVVLQAHGVTVKMRNLDDGEVEGEKKESDTSSSSLSTSEVVDGAAARLIAVSFLKTAMRNLYSIGVWE